MPRISIKSKTEYEGHKRLLDKDEKNFLDFVKSRIDETTFLKRHEKIGRKIVSLASHVFTQFEDLEKFIRENLSGMDNLERRISHEKRHAEAVESYGVDFLYCVIIGFVSESKKKDVPIVQPQEYVQDFPYKKLKRWSRENIIEYLKDIVRSGTVDEDLGKRDRRMLEILESCEI